MTFLLAILFKNACPVYRLLEGLSNLLHLDFPQFTEKFLEKRRAFFLKDSFGQLHLMIESRHIKKIQDRTGTSGFRIPTSDHDSWNPCLYNGTGTHLTRFQCNVHSTFLQPPVSHCLAGLSNRLKFCMSKGIFIRIPPIIPSCNDLPIFYDHTTDKDFT